MGKSMSPIRVRNEQAWDMVYNYLRPHLYTMLIMEDWDGMAEFWRDNRPIVEAATGYWD